MKPQNCIFFRLANAGKKAGRFWKQKVAAYGVTGVQAMVLGFLLEEDRITSVELSKRTKLDTATITGVLDRLESEGYISRKAYEGDRRAISINLTENGKDIALQTSSIIDEANKSYLGNLTHEETLILKSLLNKI